MYTRLQTVWSLPGPSRQANKGQSPRCHRRPNGPGRLADKVVQPTTQSAEGCTCNIQPKSRFLEFTPLRYPHAPDGRPEGLGVTVGGSHLLSGEDRDDLVRQVLQNHGAAPREEAAAPCRLRRRQIERACSGASNF